MHDSVGAGNGGEVRISAWNWERDASWEDPKISRTN